MLCLLHCVMLPLVATFLPFMGAQHVHHNESVHLLLLTLALPVGLLALIPGYRKHRVKWIPALGLASLVGLLCTPFMHDLGLESVEVLWSLGAGLGLVTSHLSNWAHCRTECHGSCHH